MGTLKETGELLPTRQDQHHPAATKRLEVVKRRLAHVIALALVLVSISTLVSFRVERDEWNHERLEREFLRVPAARSARRTLESFTRRTHIAGTRADQRSAQRVKLAWERALGLEPTEPDDNTFDAGTARDRRALFDRSDEPRVWISTYYPYLNYPERQSISLHDAYDPRRVVWNASLVEQAFPTQDPTSTRGVATFHGFSKNGTVSAFADKPANLVYASRGTRQDFERLEREGVRVEGNVALVQYGGTFRGLKVKAAEEAGAVACIIYSDPVSDGLVTEENGFEPYPVGPARAPSSVQRGSVQYLSTRPGDPLTPERPAYNPTLDNAPDRLPFPSDELNIPRIPSIPISYQDAIPLLNSLRGRGVERLDDDDDDKEGWKEGGLRYKGVEYWTGPGLERVEVVNLMRDEPATKVWNTMAIVPGRIEDEIVVVGNHNDAWTFGAGDPNSGTASMLEVVKSFGHLMKRRGWKPLRTILLASWDAEEYGLVGSTEFGEDFVDYLRQRVVAYLNLDVSVSGSRFELAASPSLAHVMTDCANKVLTSSRTTTTPPPVLSSIRTANDDEDDKVEQETTTRTVSQVKTLGSGSDFSVFLQYIGVAAGNLGFSGTQNDPVYHYHSNYDSFAWMERFGDPTFERHVVVSKVLGLTALRLVQDPILPLNTTAYALELEKYLTKVIDMPTFPGREQLDVTALGDKIRTLVRVSRELDHNASRLLVSTRCSDVVERDDGGLWWSRLWSYFVGHDDRTETRTTARGGISREMSEINRKKRAFESTLLVPRGQAGLVGREWYKSLVVAPGRWLGYGATTLPGLTEALELDRDVNQAAREVARLEHSLDRAIALLSE